MSETVMDPASEEEKQPLQSDGAEQKEGEESQPKEPDFCLESIPCVKFSVIHVCICGSSIIGSILSYHILIVKVTLTCILLLVLPLTKEAQNQHGLRHGDYQRYRYCLKAWRTCSHYYFI